MFDKSAIHSFVAFSVISIITGRDVKRILIISDRILHGEPGVERMQTIVAETVESFGGTATRVWTDKWDTFSVHDTLVRNNASHSRNLTLVVTVSQCQVCDTLQRQTDYDDTDWIGMCISHGRPPRDDVIHHMTLCRRYEDHVTAMRHLVTDMRLNSTVLLYDQDHPSILASEVIRQQTGQTTLIPISGMITSTQWIERQPRANNVIHRVFILSTDVADIGIIFKQALLRKLVSPVNHWLIDLTSSNMSTCALYGDNVLFLTLTEDAKKSYRFMELVNWMQNKMDAWQDYDFGSRNVTELNCSTKSQNVSNECVSGAIFDFTAHLTSNTTSHRCSPTTIASYDEMGRLTGPECPQREIFLAQFSGFYGRRLRVVTKHYPPFVNLDNGTYSGLCIELLDVLATTLNFSYDIFEVPDGKFGITDENGIWNGMIGVVHRKEADIAAAGLTITADRETVVDFSFPYWEEPSGILIRRPGEGSKLLTLLKPLQWSVWATVISEVILASVAIYACTVFANRVIVRRTDTIMAVFHNCLWYCFGVLTNQGVAAPETTAGRVVASALFFVTVAVYAAFTGNMVAILAVEKRVLPFTSLEDMVKQSDYMWGTEDGIVQMMVFQTAKSGVYSDVWKGMTSHSDSIVDGSDAGFLKTATENYAFIGDKTYLGSYAAGHCDLILLPEEFYKVGFGFALPQDWPYSAYVNDVIMKLAECGLVARWRQQYWPSSLCRMAGKRLVSRKFTLADMEGTFFAVGIGVVLALCVLLVECHRRPLRFTNCFRTSNEDVALEDIRNQNYIK